jgi:hypothetical protein
MAKQLFSIGTNAKTVKGNKYGFMTGVLYLAPSKLSGYQVCPLAAIAQCEEACLYTAGRGAFNSIQQARINKTKRFFEDRSAFMADIVWSIKSLVRKAARANLTPLVRLNGTSDIRWEVIPVTIDGQEYSNIMAAFPDIQFYDYTKDANRKDLPANYDLTFSFSGVTAYAAQVSKAIAKGLRVAVVFRKQSDIPSSFMGMECVDGDDSDIRHLDASGVVVALYAKGKAKKDTTGFVVDAGRKVIQIHAI